MFSLNQVKQYFLFFVGCRVVEVDMEFHFGENIFMGWTGFILLSSWVSLKSLICMEKLKKVDAIILFRS